LLLKVGSKADNQEQSLYLSNTDLKAHVHGIGASRAGKSKLIEYIARQLVKERNGFCLIDPGGFLYQDLVQWLAYVKPSRSEIVLFDPSYEKKVVGFNPLLIQGPKNEATISAKVDRIVALTTKALGMTDLTNAPRLERVMRCLYYVLIEQDLSLEAVRYFLSPRHLHIRDTIIDRIQSETIKDQWLMLTQGKRPEAYLNMVESTANRLFKVLTQPSVKRIIGVPENSINIGSILDNRGALIVNLQPSFAFSQDAAHIIGTFLVNEIWETVRKRTRENMRKAPKFFLLIDEFQSFATPDFAQILDQGAKYGLHLMLFHQNLNQLDSQIKTAMTACHSRFVFGGITSSDAGQMLEGSRPMFENLRDDVMAAPSLPARYFILRRPDQPLISAYTPEVHEYRVPQEKVEIYVENITSRFLSPEQIDDAMQNSFQMPTEQRDEPPIAQPNVDFGELLTTEQASQHAKPENDIKQPKPQKVERPLSYERARGTRAHSLGQNVIAGIGELYGFKSKVEKPLANGTGFVDVSLERDGLTIACEISITTSAEWETKNVIKCINAGYDHVWVVVSHIKKINPITAKIREAVSIIDQSKVKVLTTDTCFSELEKLGRRVDPKTGKMTKLAGDLLTVKEVAEYFGVRESSVYRWKNQGRLPYRQPGRKLLFERDVILVIGKQNLTGKQRTSVELDKPLKIAPPKSKTKKQQDDRYRKMLNLD